MIISSFLVHSAHGLKTPYSDRQQHGMASRLEMCPLTDYRYPCVPNTVTKDLRDKKALYERYGVREYVILDPLELYAQRFWLEQDVTYGSAEIFGPQEVLALSTLPDIEVHLWEVFGVEESRECE